MKKYTIKVTSPEHWEEIHDTLCGVSSCHCIPDREVYCWDEKLHSPTRGTFELDDDEAEELRHHEYIDWVELSPTDNPDSFPKPQPATKRFKGNVKVYRDLGTNAPPASSPTSAENRRTNWAVKRVGVQTNGDGWPGVTGNPASINSDISYSLTGKHVDIVIHDSGVMQYHPEFLNPDGKSRVKDIVLDGPYYIDPDYFTDNSLTYTKTDGRVGIATTAAEEWWENTTKRSAPFQSEGTVAIPATYTENNALGIGGTDSGLTNGHGTACAGLAAGKYMGLAFEANIWSMPAISDNVGMGIEASYDLIKIWHRNKPTNTTTGRANPTVVNGSWGYQAAFDSTDTVNYKFRGSTGSFTGNASVTDQVTAMKEGLTNQVTNAYKSWSTSSRSSSTNTAGDELMAEGVIYIAAAGNNNQRLGIGAGDTDRLNYMDDDWFSSGDPRSEFPGNACPCNHRDWMNPQGIGFDSGNDFHPVICVGAMDEFIESDLSERKASYSNNGPGIDVWAPADETLAPGTNGVSSYEDFQRFDDDRFYDTNFNGTSAAAPVVTGLIALYLESNPSATSADVRAWLKRHGSRVVPSSQYVDVQSDDTTTAYWTGLFNLRGAERRLLYDPSANDVIPKIVGADITGFLFDQGSSSQSSAGSSSVAPVEGGDSGGGGGGGGGALSISITSSSFTSGNAIGGAYYITGGNCHPNAANTSPQVSWTVSGDTSGAAGIMCLCTDPDDSNFIHWFVMSIPVESGSISENGSWPSGSSVQTNSWDGVLISRANGWGGPCPPSQHTYNLWFEILDSENTTLATSNTLTFTAG